MKVLEPCTRVIFCAAGNLSRRKLIPSLVRLEMAKRLPERRIILGCGIELVERGTCHLFDRDDLFWRHSLNLDGADLQAY
jgi:glucose-6-phosphate 1-dehydrogenase